MFHSFSSSLSLFPESVSTGVSCVPGFDAGFLFWFKTFQTAEINSYPRCWCFLVLAGFFPIMRNHAVSCEIMPFQAASCNFGSWSCLDFPTDSGRISLRRKGPSFVCLLPSFHWYQCCCSVVPRWSFSNFVFSHHRVAIRWSSRQKYVATTVFASTGRHLYGIQ